MTWRARRWLLLAATALVLAPSAAAKGPATLEICGAEACRTFETSAKRDDRNLELVFSALNVAVDSTAYAPAPAPALFYTLRVSAEWVDEVETRTYVRSHGLVSLGNSWIRLDPSLARRYARASARLAPLPPPVIRAARVGGMRVDDLAPYARLLEELPRTYPRSPGQPHVDVALTPDRVTPWVDPTRPLRFFPATDLLRRGSEWVRVPPDVAAAIEEDAASTRTDAGRTSIGALAAVAAPLLALAGGAGVVLARRRGFRRASAA